MSFNGIGELVEHTRKQKNEEKSMSEQKSNWFTTLNLQKSAQKSFDEEMARFGSTINVPNASTNPTKQTTAAKKRGVGFRLARGTQVCREGGAGGAQRRCVEIDLDARPWGPTGDGPLDWTQFLRRYQGGVDDGGWPQGMANELFGKNFEALHNAHDNWLKTGNVSYPSEGSAEEWDGEPLQEETHDLAFSMGRGDSFYVEFGYMYPPGREGTVPENPAPTFGDPKGPKYTVEKNVMPGRRTVYSKVKNYDGTGPIYGPGYPHVLESEKSMNPAPAPKPTPIPTPTPQLNPTPVPTPAPPVNYKDFPPWQALDAMRRAILRTPMGNTSLDELKKEIFETQWEQVRNGMLTTARQWKKKK